MIKHIHESGRKVAALCGFPVPGTQAPTRGSTSSSPRVARPAGTAAKSARSCCGRRSSRKWRRSPCWRPGGIGSGGKVAAAWPWVRRAWTGSQWLMVEEAENTPVQQRAYAKATRPRHRPQSVVHRQVARMLRNDWTEAWEQPDNPKPLGMPLQYMVSGMAVAATHRYPDETASTSRSIRVGQVVGQLTKVEKTSTVIERWCEYLDATNTTGEESTPPPSDDAASRRNCSCRSGLSFGFLVAKQMPGATGFSGCGAALASPYRRLQARRAT